MQYYDTYLLRLNKYGTTLQERIKGMRERDFDLFLSKSIYQVDTTINGQQILGSLEPNKQDEKASTAYFLVKNGSNLKAGSIFNEPQDNHDWMVIYRVDNFARGYEKYMVAKLDQTIEWMNPNKEWFSSKCYMFGQLTRIIEDRFRNYKGDPTYREDIKVVHVVMPLVDIEKDSYTIINDEAYVITGYDIVSIQGVMYITLNATFKKNLDPIPEVEPETDDNFWFNGVPQG